MFWIYTMLILCALSLIASFVYENAEEIEMLIIEAKELLNHKNDLA